LSSLEPLVKSCKSTARLEADVNPFTVDVNLYNAHAVLYSTQTVTLISTYAIFWAFTWCDSEWDVWSCSYL